jgi:hypothetical protein
MTRCAVQLAIINQPLLAPNGGYVRASAMDRRHTK